MSKQNQIEIPKYVLEGNQNIPSDLKKVLDYFRDCGNKNYEVCLVGEKESVAKDLKENGYQDKYPFIHLDNNSLNSIYGFLPVSVKNSIRRINKLISNPDTPFNRTKLGIHTLGLVFISEIQPLNDLRYGTATWNGVGVFARRARVLAVVPFAAEAGRVSGDVSQSQPYMVFRQANSSLNKKKKKFDFLILTNKQ